MKEFIDQLISLKFAISIVMLIVLWMWESWRPFFEIKGRRYWHAIQNLSVTLSNTFLIALIFSSLTFFVVDWTARNQTGILNWLYVSKIPLMFLAIILLDAWMYFWHRMNHVIPILWRFHKTHHSDNRMDVTTTSRFHLIEQIISASLRLALIPLLGIQLSHLIVYDTLLILNTQIHHSNISIGKWDRYLRFLIVTPDMHKIHHSRILKETNSNYSVLFSIWDRIAYSFRIREDIDSIQFGLDHYDDERWQSFWGILKTPFVPVNSDSERIMEESD